MSRTVFLSETGDTYGVIKIYSPEFLYKQDAPMEQKSFHTHP